MQTLSRAMIPTATTGWLSTILCPILGMVIANAMFLSPLKAVLAARKRKDLGQLNSIPWILILLNCFGWSFYGCLRKDYFLFWSNFPAICFSLFYNLTAIQLLALRGCKGDYVTIAALEILCISGAFLWGIVSMAAVIAIPAPQARLTTLIVGYTSCVFTVSYYASPLSTIKHVFITRDASSLYLPSIIANLVNSVLWVVYGFAIGDLILLAPNALGTAFAIFQICVTIMFRILRGPLESRNDNPLPPQLSEIV